MIGVDLARYDAPILSNTAPSSIFLGGAFIAKNPFLYPSSGYDPVIDLAPVIKVCEFTNVMVVPNSAPSKSVGEFIDYADANRGKITFASSGTGAEPHMSAELFRKLAGTDDACTLSRQRPALNDLIRGRVDVYFGTLPSTLSLALSGQVRALAVTSAQRSVFAPELPTVAESGLPGYDYSSWYALYVPAKTPTNIVQKIHADAATALARSRLKQRFAELGTAITPSTTTELAALLKSDMELWGPVIKAAGIKGE
jgi:tripartite-type tricarboxylate transporter receptor subunit TctC